MMEVTPMLRHLLSSLGTRQTSEIDSAPTRDVAHLSDKLERRQRQSELHARQPRSVCSSLRDICEM
jgi:hypothetical protein